MENATLMIHTFGMSLLMQILVKSVYHVFYLVKQVLVSGLEYVISCVSCLRTSPQRMAKSVAIINSYLFLSNCHRYKSDSKHHFVSKSIIIIINDYLMSINYNILPPLTTCNHVCQPGINNNNNNRGTCFKNPVQSHRSHECSL